MEREINDSIQQSFVERCAEQSLFDHQAVVFNIIFCETEREPHNMFAVLPEDCIVIFHIASIYS